MNYPYVLGALWNGEDEPPETNSDGKNNIRLIKSRSGHVIRLNDEDGKEKIEIIDKSEKNSIVFDTAENTIEIKADKDITLSAPNGKIRLDAQEIETKSSEETRIESEGEMNVESDETMNIKGLKVNIN